VSSVKTREKKIGRTLEPMDIEAILTPVKRIPTMGPMKRPMKIYNMVPPHGTSKLQTVKCVC
jgi:hypothetical protein